jgi:hypothetical protein
VKQVVLFNAVKKKKIKENRMGSELSTASHLTEKEFIHLSSDWKEGDHLLNLSDDRLILKYFLMKQDVRVWTKLILIRKRC